MAIMAMTTSNSMRVKAQIEVGGFSTEGNQDNEGDGEAGAMRLKAAVCEAAVARICNLLYRRIAFGRA
jgi:hypothetical protein